MSDSIAPVHATSGQVLQAEMAPEGALTATPPTFSLAGDGPAVQRQEAPDAAPVAENEGPAVADEHRDPLQNSNTTLQNLELLIGQWEALDETGDDRKLAYILASADHETGHTMHGIHEGFGGTYWPAYANTGYWGRGFIQLTHEGNYEQMEDETGVDLTQYEEAALLPTVSSIVTVDGMVDGEFRGDRQGRHDLDRYFETSEGENGETVQGDADWSGARNIVNGDAAGNGQRIGQGGQRILAGITAYRNLSEEDRGDQTLAQYLYNETDLFQNGRVADVNRVLEAMGHHEYWTPGFTGGATALQQEYITDISQTGYYNRINRVDTGALSAFQIEFNAAHNLEEPLRTDGVLDDPTFEAVMRLGNQIQAGEDMIEYAFSGDVEAINPVTQAFDEHTAGTRDVTSLAQRLVALMPVPTAADVTGSLTVELAFAMAINAPSHNDLAYFNREILEAMQGLLNASQNPQHQTMGQRIQCLTNYVPANAGGQHIEYRVQSGDSLGRIARNHNTTVNAIVEYNATHGNSIPNINNIGIGDLILFPNPDYDPDATTETPTCELEAFPLPPAPITDNAETPTTGNETPTTEGDQSAAPAQSEGWFASLLDNLERWANSLFGGDTQEG